MTAIRGCKTRILIDELDLSLQVSNFNMQNSVAVIAYNTLQVCAGLKLPSLPNGMLNVNGYMDDNGDDTLAEKIRTALTTEDTYIGFVIESTPPVGLVFDGSFVSSSTVDTPLEGLITLASTWEKINERTDGNWIVVSTTLDATGAQTGIDFGSQGTTGGKAFLFVHSITGTATDATIDVESDDNSGFTSEASEGTFTFSDVGVYELTLSGTVDRYIRANLTDLGGADDISFSILVGVNGVTQ